MIDQSREAKLYFGDGNFDILQPGDFVTCAVTGQRILLTNLRYWSVERQQAYATAEVAVAALTESEA